jgi:hypothetical protein
MKPHTFWHLFSCDRQVELLASLTLRPLITGMMSDLLATYPAPQYFDARGKATVPFQLTNVGVYKENNWITLYGAIPVP